LLAERFAQQNLSGLEYVLRMCWLFREGRV
jgi:hypothetical protein